MQKCKGLSTLMLSTMSRPGSQIVLSRQFGSSVLSSLSHADAAQGLGLAVDHEAGAMQVPREAVTHFSPPPRGTSWSGVKYPPSRFEAALSRGLLR